MYRDLWPGIDLVFHGRGSRLKYEFHVAPGADPSRIRLAYDGARDVSLGHDGALELDTALGTAPRLPAAELADDRRPARRGLRAATPSTAATETFGFALGAFDREPRARHRPRTRATRRSSAVSSNDFGIDLAVDRKGNAYVTRPDHLRRLPEHRGLVDRGGAADAFVAKLDPSGTKLRYATYLGGSGAGGRVVDRGRRRAAAPT